MKILALEKELKSGTEYNRKLLKIEAMKVLELYEEGFIREIYFDKNNHSAVIIIECRDEEEARAVLDSLPLVKEGLITFKIISLIPYNGFSRLSE